MPPLRTLPATFLALTACAVLSGWPGVVRAQTLSWVLDPATPHETRERIEGQTSDLTFARLPAAQVAGVADPSDPLAHARRLASDGGARVVVWTLEQETTLTVTIVDLEGRRVLVREVVTDRGRDHSAALETVGLIVRSALQALADGGEIGVATVTAERAPDPVTVDDPQPPGAPSDDAENTDDADDTDEAPTEDLVASEWMLGAGVTMTSIVNDGPALGGSGRLSWRHGLLWLGLSAGATTRQVVRSAEAAIDVAYLGASLEAGVVAVERGAFTLVPLAALDVGRVRRETTRVGDGFAGTASRSHLDTRVGAGVLGRLRLGEVAWLTLSVRLDVPLLAVRYSVINEGERGALARTPRLAAALGLSVLARVGRGR